MVNSITKSRLSVAQGMASDQPLVVACGYNGRGEFGYFICTETVLPGTPPTYQYTNIVSFTKKSNEGTFQQVLKQFKALIS
jgi:hypothetical protein